MIKILKAEHDRLCIEFTWEDAEALLEVIGCVKASDVHPSVAAFISAVRSLGSAEVVK